MDKPNPLDLTNYRSHGELGIDERAGEHLGQYLVRKKIISNQILQYALEKQIRTGMVLGEILEKENFIPIDLLREYSLNRLFNPNRSETIANLLLRVGRINEQQKRELLIRHRKSGRALGAIAIDEGIISVDDFSQDRIVPLLKL